MPVRVPNISVIVRRDGKNVRVPPGHAYDFTQGEIEDALRHNLQALRKPVAERPVQEAEVTSDPDFDDDDLEQTAAMTKPVVAKRGTARGR